MADTAADATEAAGIRPLLVTILATACAISVANLYYNQPLLVPMARTFRATPGQIGIVPTLTQIGYATGLFLLVPLGDIVEGRRLILFTLAAVTLALFATAWAPTLPLLALFSFLIGVSTVVPQMLIPFGVRLAAPHERGKTVGGIMSGLLLGLLLSRTIAGWVGAHAGWRTMYLIAGCRDTIRAVRKKGCRHRGTRRFLPRTGSHSTLLIGGMMRSLT